MVPVTARKRFLLPIEKLYGHHDHIEVPQEIYFLTS